MENLEYIIFWTPIFYLMKPKWKINYFNIVFSVIINMLFLDSELEIIKVSKITKIDW